MPSNFDGTLALVSNPVMIASGKAKPDRYWAVSWYSERLLMDKVITGVRWDWRVACQ